MNGKFTPPLLIVSKENRLAEILGAASAVVHADADAALHALSGREVALLLIEMNVAGDINALIKRALEIDSNTQILLLANEMEVPLSLQGINLGAALVLPRPCHDESLNNTLKYMSEHWKQHREHCHHRMGADAELLGSSPLTVALKERVLKLSGLDATVLVSGEPGSGKSHLARFIHFNSLRAQENFSTLNCTKLSPTEIEVALFGTEDGGKIGALSAASGGSLYIHDVERLPGKLQERLLKFLKEKNGLVAGDKSHARVEIRVLSSTSVNLRELVRQSKFREDLYWELCGVALEIPPIHERMADIEELLLHFLSGFSRKLGKTTPAIPAFLMEKIKAHPFPGNVSELKSLAGVMVALSEGGEVSPASLPAQMLAPIQVGKISTIGALALKPVVHEFEKQYLLRVLKAVNGNQSKASRALDIHRNTLILKMQELGIPNKREVKGK